MRIKVREAKTTLNQFYVTGLERFKDGSDWKNDVKLNYFAKLSLHKLLDVIVSTWLEALSG